MLYGPVVMEFVVRRIQKSNVKKRPSVLKQYMRSSPPKMDSVRPDGGQGRERKVHVVLSVRYVQQRKHLKGEGVRRILVCQDDCTLRQAKRAVDELCIMSRVRSGWLITERCGDLPSPVYFRSAKTSPGIFRCSLHIHRGKAGGVGGVEDLSDT